MAGGIVAMGLSGCGFLNVEDVELGQLPMVTETGEWSSPVDTAGHLCNCKKQLCNQICIWLHPGVSRPIVHSH